MPTKEAIVEGLKEVARLILFAAVGIVLTYLINQVSTLPQTETTAIILLLLRGVDKMIHESKTGVFKNIQGLSPI